MKKNSGLLTEEYFDIEHDENKKKKSKKVKEQKEKKPKQKKNKVKEKKESKVEENNYSKNTKRVFIIFLVVILGYFVYKSFNLFYYDVHNKMLFGLPDDYEEIYDGIYFQNGFSVISRGENYKDSLKYKNIKIKNYFKDFKLDDKEKKNDNGVWYHSYDKDGKIKNSFYMGINDTYIDKFIKEDSDRRLKHINKREIIRKNKINNDIEFLRFLRKNKSTKVDLFTPVKDLKEKFALDYFVVLLPKVKQLNLISGDYMGYSFDTYNNGNRLFQAVILKDDKSYVFSFVGDKSFVKDEFIDDVLDSLVIS